MAEPIISPEAQAEIDEIFDHIADDNLEAAHRLMRLLDDTFEL